MSCFLFFKGLFEASLPLSLQMRMFQVCFWNLESVLSIYLSSSPCLSCQDLDFAVSFHNLDMQLPLFLLNCVSVDFCCPPSAPQRPSEAQSQCSGRTPDRLAPHHLCSRRNQLLWDALCIRGHPGSKILRGHHRWALIQDYTDYGFSLFFLFLLYSLTMQGTFLYFLLNPVGDSLWPFR